MIAKTDAAYTTAGTGDVGPVRARIRAVRPARLLARLAALMGAARRRARDRAILTQMPHRLARDVGLTDASRAPLPPPGRVPDFW